MFSLLNAGVNKMSSQNKHSGKYLFWTRMQVISLSAFLTSIVLCFIRSWLFIFLAILFLIINGISYKKRMLSLGKDPSTKDINEVV